jgi:endonuclease/exonuclease/phosphatase family metal-dependent hydrolase
MKVMTFNIQHAKNYLEGHIDIPLMAKTIKELGADIIALQEVYGIGEKETFNGQAEKIAEILGYHCYFAEAIYINGYGPYGNAILSRYEILDAKTVKVPPAIPVPGRYFEDRCLGVCHVNTPNGKLAVFAIHFGLQPEEAVLCAKTVCNTFDPSVPTVLMGDFNLEPDSEYLDPIRNIFVDTDKFFKGESNLTFPSDKPEIKIDYIFVSPDINVRNVDVPKNIAADHLTIVADIDF